MKQTPRFVDEWSSGLPVAIGKLLVLSITLLFVTTAIIVFWAVVVPLGGAVVSYGRVIAEGKNITIKHLEGGIVSEIRVREGEEINKDQTLIVLDKTYLEAKLRQYEIQRDQAEIMISRLEAEENKLEHIVFPERLLKMAETNLSMKTLLDAQTREFEANRDEVRSEIASINKKIETLKVEIEGYEKLIESFWKQIVLLDEEINLHLQLLEKGLTKRSIILSLQRSRARTKGDIDAITADLNANRTKITDLEIQQNKYVFERKKTINSEIIKERTSYAESSEAIDSLKDKIRRTNILAPVDGKIVKIYVNSKDSIISPAENIMEILPHGEPLSIEANAATEEIDQIKLNQSVRIYFPGIQDSNNDYIRGKVIYISPDTIYDKEHKANYYPVRVEISQKTSPIAKLIYPGMLAEVHITSKPETFATILSDPIIRSANRAFKE